MTHSAVIDQGDFKVVTYLAAQHRAWHAAVIGHAFLGYPGPHLGGYFANAQSVTVHCARRLGVWGARVMGFKVAGRLPV